MKNIETRIGQATAELAILSAPMIHPEDMHPQFACDARARILARTEKRLADLIAVRDGKAVEVYATVSVSGPSESWIAYGMDNEDPASDLVQGEICHEPNDRLTVLRGIALLPETMVGECEAEGGES